MKICIPNQIDASEFNDGELMITALLYMIANKYDYKSWYNINGGDFRKIVYPASASTPRVFGPRTARLREIIDFAVLDPNNICMRFSTLKPTRQGVGKLGTPQVGPTMYELKDMRSIKIWCYLLGQWHGKNELITETDNLIVYTDSKRSVNNLEYNNFLVG